MLAKTYIKNIQTISTKFVEYSLFNKDGTLDNNIEENTITDFKVLHKLGKKLSKIIEKIDNNEVKIIEKKVIDEILKDNPNKLYKNSFSIVVNEWGQETQKEMELNLDDDSYVISLSWKNKTTFEGFNDYTEPQFMFLSLNEIYEMIEQFDLILNELVLYKRIIKVFLNASIEKKREMISY